MTNPNHKKTTAVSDGMGGALPHDPKTELPVNYRALSWEQKRDIRNEYVKLQEGECYWCGAQLTAEPKTELLDIPVDWSLFPGGEEFLKYPVHLQHDHTTNMTEGAVHSLCNAIMWNYFRR